MNYLETMDAIKTGCAVGGFVFAALSWWKANHIAAVQATIETKVDTIGKQTDGLTKALVDKAEEAAGAKATLAEKDAEHVRQGEAAVAKSELPVPTIAVSNGCNNGRPGAGYEEMKTPPKRG